MIEHSKEQCSRICQYIGADAERFGELMHCYLQNDYRLNQRAAWVVTKVVEKYPFLLENYFGEILEKLNGETAYHQAVKRNVIRLFSMIPIPKKWEGEIYDLCFRTLENNQEPIATKVFSMETCYQISRHYPELRNEVKWAIEENLLKFGDQSPGIQNRGQKLLKKMKKQQ